MCSWIYSTLPKNKQVLALSATYPEYLAEHLINYMNEPAHIRLSTEKPTLLGNKHFPFVLLLLLFRCFTQFIMDIIEICFLFDPRGMLCCSIFY